MNFIDKNSLKVKLVIASIIIVIIPMAFATTYSIRNFLNLSKREVKLSLDSEVNAVDIMFSSNLNKFSELAKTLSHNFALVTPLQFGMNYQVIKYGDEILKNNKKIDKLIISSGNYEDVIFGEKNLYLDILKKVSKNKESFIGISETGYFIGCEPILSSKKELLGTILITYNFLKDTEAIIEISKRINSNLLFYNNNELKIWSDINGIKDVKHILNENIMENIKKEINFLYNEAVEIDGKEYFVKFKALEDIKGNHSFIYAVSEDKEKISEIKNKMLWDLSLISFGGVSFAFILIILLSHILLKPLKRLELAAKLISNGDYSAKVKIENKDEIGNLAIAFNNMTNKIKESFAKIKEQEEEYRSLVENLNIGIYRTSFEENGTIIKTNTATARIIGARSIDEILNKSVMDFYQNPKSRNNVLNVIKNQGSIKNLIIPFRRMNGEKIWCSLTANVVYSENGKEKWIDGTIEDISEKKQIEEELKKYREKLEVLVEERTKELSSAMESLKKSQNKLIESEKMAALGQLVAGVAHEINTPLGAINSSVDNILKSLEDSMENYFDYLCNIPKDLRKIFTKILSRALKHETFLTTREERKIRKNIKMKLEAYNINKAEMIADNLVDIGIYEDYEEYMLFFRNENIEKTMEFMHKISGLKRNANTILTATNQASKVVFALKTFSHYDRIGEMIESDISKGIETVLTLYHNKIKYGVNLIKNYEDIPNIKCYPDELNQVWTNIIHNALQAMDYKGELIIEIKKLEKTVEVSISDNGSGVDEAIKDKIFEPFFTTKNQGEGSGLGLDIVKKIIKKHKGEIRLETVPGKTSFIVALNI